MKSETLKNSEDMILLAEVVNAGSITAASDVVGLDRSSLSRRLKNLERRLGATLFDRRGQSLRLTETGDLYLVYCRRVRELVREAEQRAAGSLTMTPGALNVFADFDDADLFLEATIDDFTARHRDVRVTLSLAEVPFSTLPDAADLVIQLGARRLPGAEYYDLALVNQSVWASTRIVERTGDCIEPSDLASLPAVGLAGPTDGTEIWRLECEADLQTVHIAPRFRYPSKADCRKACIDGLGIALLPNYLCTRAAARGELVRMMPNWRLPGLRLTAAHHISMYVPRSTQALVEHCRRVHGPPPG